MSPTRASQPVAVPNDLESYWIPFTPNRAFKAAPRLIARAKDMHYYTPDGRAVLDGTAGLWCTNAGHNREPIVAAIRAQAGELDYAPAFQFSHPKAFELAALHLQWLGDAGLAPALSTDFNPGTSPTCSMPMVLSLACTHMCMSPAEAVSAATINGAHALLRSQYVGSLDPGKQADLCIMQVENYRQIPYFFGMNHCKMTLKKGKIVYQRPV
jgi:hypothetical protein